eukprot:gene760-24_t
MWVVGPFQLIAAISSENLSLPARVCNLKIASVVPSNDANTSSSVQSSMTDNRSDGNSNRRPYRNDWHNGQEHSNNRNYPRQPVPHNHGRDGSGDYYYRDNGREYNKYNNRNYNFKPPVPRNHERRDYYDGGRDGRREYREVDGNTGHHDYHRTDWQNDRQCNANSNYREPPVQQNHGRGSRDYDRSSGQAYRGSGNRDNRHENRGRDYHRIDWQNDREYQYRNDSNYSRPPERRNSGRDDHDMMVDKYEYDGRDRSRTRHKEEKHSSSRSDESVDSDRSDQIVHCKWHKGMTLQDGRYEVKRLLGDGTFGRVLEAHVRQRDRSVGIKIIRDVADYIEDAEIESDILEKVWRRDTNHRGQRRCVRMYGTFSIGNHYAMIFETCGSSLYDFLKRNNRQGFFLADIQVIAAQCLECLDFLHHEMDLTHTDLKCENLLFTC